MAVSRWFGGIIAEKNLWSGSTMVAEADRDTYFISFQVQSDSAVKFIEFEIFGEPAVSVVGKPIRGFYHPAISQSVSFQNNTIRKLKERSGVVPICRAKLANNWVIAYGTYAWFPKTEGNRTDDVILKGLTESNRKTVAVLMDAPNTNYVVGEVQIDPANKFIVQPAHENGMWKGAVADELNLVSTSAEDAIGGTGMQKARFTYWDANFDPQISAEIEMGGLTPQNIIGSYADVYLINQVFGTQFGSAGHNVGNIFLQGDDV